MVVSIMGYFYGGVVVVDVVLGGVVVGFGVGV